MAYCAYCGSHVAQVSFVPCASCGNPTNGAPPRPQVSGGVNPAAMVIGIVAAAFVFIAIIGILAAIAIPNMLTAMQRSRQKRTMADMRSIAVALETYGVDHPQENYPEGTTVEALRSHLQPKYTSNLVANDAWETPMRYMPLEEHGYVIISAGKDKKFEHESPEEYTAGVTSNFDCDIVFANGSFVQYPDNITGTTTTTGGGQ